MEEWGRGGRGGRGKARLCLDPDSCTGCSGCDFRPWRSRTDKVPDITVNQRNFCPANPVGPTLAPGRWTPLALFKYFFPDNSVSIICRNTNANAAKNQLSGKSTHGLILHGWCRKPYRLEGGTGQDQHQNVVAS